MVQPRKEEITEKLKMVVDGRLGRDDVETWACEFIKNDNSFKLEDIQAWHYLTSCSCINEMTAPDVYLYSIEDIKGWISRYDF